MNSWALLCLTAFAATPVDFSTEVIPVLTKVGCNSGACHGAAAGRGGMHLSLLGADPSADYETIVQALEGRRINQAYPEQSLFLRKPTGQIDHGGDVVLAPDGSGAKRILDWIRAGALKGSRRQLTQFEITPARHLAAGLPAQVPLRVTARFDNGSVEDVTAWTVLTPSDSGAVEIDGKSVAHIKRCGQHVVIARYLDRVAPIQLTVPLSETTVDLSTEPRANFIDDEIYRTLTDLRLLVSPAADDAVYLRRVSLDLTGRLPEPAVVEAFLAESSTDKRVRLVDILLASEAFADYWTLRFARLLRIHSLPNEKEIVGTYAGWLRRELRSDTGFDQIAWQLLTATGDSHRIGPANFARMVNDARGHAELVGQVFLGARLGCANCHNHPLDKWTQDDYHGLASVFARLERSRNVQILTRGAVTNLRTGEPAIPRIPGVRDLSPDQDHRGDIADWLISPDNKAFPKATVNRLWRTLFGRGLVEPPDDLRETNPATHPELLDRLADDFVKHRYSIRHTLKLIALSQTYGRGEAIPSNTTDDRFYSHAYRRPLEPEVLLDAISDVTGVPEEFPDQPPGTRAVTLIDPLAPALSLDVLGRCNRAAGCDEGSSSRSGLAAQLHLINGALINRKLTDPQGRLKRLIAAGYSNREIIQNFHLIALGYAPTAEQAERWQQRLDAEGDKSRKERLEDFVWSLLNSRLFRENH